MKAESVGVMECWQNAACFHHSITPILHHSIRLTVSSTPLVPFRAIVPRMALDATTRRRWFGALVLLAALGMLIGGETVLKEKLGNLGFMLYWLVCFGFTGLAIVIAFLDARALQRRTHQEQHDLFEATLRQIETEAKARPRRPDRRTGRP